MKYFIIHGSFGNPDENWFPWLKKELEERKEIVFVPKFPTPKNQRLNLWLDVFKKYEKEIDCETIFIAHSLGPAFILSVLEKINCRVKGCIFVSGFLGLLDNQSFNEINKTFTTKVFDWSKIRKNCELFYVINSKDDPYVPFEKAKQLALQLNTKEIKFETGGHFNSDSGFDKFEYLLKVIDQIKK